MTLKKFRCFFLGHKPKDFTDSGWEICDRCEAHEYYDGWHKTLPVQFHYLKWDAQNLIKRVREFFYSKCHDCGKRERVFGVNVGDHSKCLPF